MKIKMVPFTLLLSSVCLAGLIFSDAIGEQTAKRGTKKMTKTGISPKIAIVDVRQILTQDPQALKERVTVSHEWLDLYNKLQETLRPANQEMSELQAQHATKRKELEALQKSGVSSQESLREKYEKELAPLEYRYQTQSQQIQRFTYDELTKIQAMVGPKIQKVVDEIIAKQGWDFAISREVVTSTITSTSQFNITSDVLSTLNAQYASSKPKQPQPQETKKN